MGERGGYQYADVVRLIRFVLAIANQSSASNQCATLTTKYFFCRMVITKYKLMSRWIPCIHIVIRME